LCLINAVQCPIPCLRLVIGIADGSNSSTASTAHVHMSKLGLYSLALMYTHGTFKQGRLKFFLLPVDCALCVQIILPMQAHLACSYLCTHASSHPRQSSGSTTRFPLYKGAAAHMQPHITFNKTQSYQGLSHCLTLCHVSTFGYLKK
jgi:hypothetical protein